MLRNKSHLMRRNGYYILRLKKADADAALLFLAFWFLFSQRNELSTLFGELFAALGG